MTTFGRSSSSDERYTKRAIEPKEKTMSDKFASINLTMGQVNAIVKKLGGEKGALGFLRGDTIMVDRVATPFLSQSIIMGNGLCTAQILRSALVEEDFLMEYGADAMLDSPNFMYSTEPVNANLVIISVGDLGFPGGANCGEIFTRAETIGLVKNISEAGPQLRLQYKNQPKGERIIIAMIPLEDTMGKPHLYAVETLEQNGQWLSAVDGDPEYLWGPKTKWAFQRRN